MIGREGPGPERPGPDYPPEWDLEPDDDDNQGDPVSTTSPPVRLTPGTRALTTEEVDRHVRAVLSSRAATARTVSTLRLHSAELSEAAVLTVASWYQGPAGVGAVLASLASGAAVGRDALLADVDATIRETEDTGPAGTAEEHDADLQALALLRSWVEARP